MHVTRKKVLSILSVAVFLFGSMAFSAGSISAAEDWPVWPRKGAPPPAEQPLPLPEQPAPPAAEPLPLPSPPPSAAAEAGESAGTQAASGISGGTIAAYALGGALLIGGAIAIGGGGGGGGGTTSNH